MHAPLSDFPVTRDMISRLPKYVDVFAQHLPRPVKAPHPSGEYLWQYEAQDAKTLQVGKAVRVASGLRAAILLADMRHTIEVLVILRTVSDFNAEIHFVAEGMLSGEPNSEHDKFIRQHFEPMPTTPDAYAAMERELYVGRKAIARSFRRVAERTKMPEMPAEQLLSYTAYLHKGYDGVVHGKSYSAMELFTGTGYRFMMTGNESDDHVRLVKAGVAGKVKESLNALKIMAMAWDRSDLFLDLRALYQRLDESRESSVES